MLLTQSLLSFSARPVASSDAGEREMSLSLTESAEVAEKTPKRVTHRGMGSYFGFVAFPVGSAASAQRARDKAVPDFRLQDSGF